MYLLFSSFQENNNGMHDDTAICRLLTRFGSLPERTIRSSRAQHFFYVQIRFQRNALTDWSDATCLSMGIMSLPATTIDVKSMKVSYTIPSLVFNFNYIFR